MKKRFFSILIVNLLFLWFFFGSKSTLTAKTSQPPYFEAVDKFEKFMEKQMVLDKVPGMSIGFLKGDFIWANGYGYSDLENKVPAKPESAYRLASLTKTITAIAVLQLVEAGKIDLDSEVQNYVPYFPKKKWPVTIRLLLGHLGGISHYKDYNIEGRIKVHKNTIEALAIFQDWDLVTEPGTNYHYSSYGYNLLGAVIEGIAGVSYGDYIKEHIFNPLGMTNSRLDDPVDLIPNRVRGYRLINGDIKNSEYVDVSSRFAGGGTRSTVLDLLKYARGVIDGELLKEETWKLMFTSMASRNRRFTFYGMGWRVQPWRGHFQVSHGGSQPETRTHLIIFPTEEFAIAIASNLERLDLMPYVRRLAETVLGEDLDSLAYASNRAEQAMYNHCAEVFSHGLSQFDWHNSHIAKDEKDLAEAFAYFRQYIDRNALQKNFRETEKKILNGFHPLSNQALIKVGTFMASTIKNEMGEGRLQSYHQSGPLAFFKDYINISNEWPPENNEFKFDSSFAKLISSWERDWSAAYTDEISHLNISVSTDFDQLVPKLKKTFAGAEFYPDLTREMERVGQYFLWNNEAEKALQIFNLSHELYPNSSRSLIGLATAHVWKGNVKEARNLFKQAFEFNPGHPSVNQSQFFFIARKLEEAEKMEEVFALADIALELYPKSARLHLEIAGLYLKTGDKEKARKHYAQALDLNPKLEEAKRKLEQLEKEKY